MWRQGWNCSGRYTHTAEWLDNLFQAIWDKGEVPKGWKQGLIVKYQREAIFQNVEIGEELL